MKLKTYNTDGEQFASFEDEQNNKQKVFQLRFFTLEDIELLVETFGIERTINELELIQEKFNDNNKNKVNAL